MPDALAVVDRQEGVLDDCVRLASVLDATRTLLGGARAAGVPVVWVQHEGPGLEQGSGGWALALRAADHLVF
jgi:nicotinamidase-related amidase